MGAIVAMLALLNYATLVISNYGEVATRREPGGHAMRRLDPIGAASIGRWCAVRSSLTAIVAVLALAGCDGSDSPPVPTNSASPTRPTTTIAGWESKYSAGELEFFQQAVQRADSYEVKAQPMWAAGKATQEAKELFQDNLMTWRVAWTRLKSYEAQGIRIARAPKVLSSEAESVKLLGGAAGETKILRCVDATDLGGTINGDPLQEGTKGPVVQHITAVRDVSGAWLFSDFDTTDKPCDR